MKKALTYAIFGINIFLLLFFGLGLHNVIIIITEWSYGSGYDLMRECIAGLLLYGGCFILLRFIAPFILIPLCVSVFIKKRLSDKFIRVNRRVFLSFIAYYVLLLFMAFSA